ncbi:uncharacterized protein [Lolium perenne]|uniref:uncharacterized protein n=1 Tax=Lolium perenne TaxID=4522 RepID=UPI0021F5122E|nr:uncharacterized protein LOC127305280 [Lolium perenne]
MSSSSCDHAIGFRDLVAGELRRSLVAKAATYRFLAPRRIPDASYSVPVRSESSDQGSTASSAMVARVSDLRLVLVQKVACLLQISIRDPQMGFALFSSGCSPARQAASLIPVMDQIRPTSRQDHEVLM